MTITFRALSSVGEGEQASCKLTVPASGSSYFWILPDTFPHHHPTLDVITLFTFWRDRLLKMFLVTLSYLCLIVPLILDCNPFEDREPVLLIPVSPGPRAGSELPKCWVCYSGNLRLSLRRFFSIHGTLFWIAPVWPVCVLWGWLWLQKNT